MISKRLLGAMLVAVVLIAGCKKDETEKNYFEYNGKKYVIAKGFIENYGKSSDELANNLDVTFITKDINIVELDGEVDELTGTGSGIYLWMYSANPTSLVNGVYNYDEDGTEESGTFEDGDLYINVNFSNMTADVYNSIKGGSVTVSKSGDVYDISFNLVDEEGKTVKGSYKGTLAYYNYTLKKSTKDKPQKVR